LGIIARERKDYKGINISDGNGTFFMPQQGLKFVGEFSNGRPTGQVI